MSADDETLVRLDESNPEVKAIAEFLKSATQERSDWFFARAMRRGAFLLASDMIGHVDSVTAKALIQMFRAGKVAGHAIGYDKGHADALRDSGVA